MKIGDLVWLPSNITLLQFEETPGIVANKFLKLDEPTNVLLVDKSEVYYKILFDGQAWHVRHKDAYALEEENDNAS